MLPGARDADVLYTASKGAIHATVGPLAREYGPLVRVNCIAPGDVATETERALAARGRRVEADAGAAWHEVAARSALGRWVRADEIADAVLFFGAVRGDDRRDHQRIGWHEYLLAETRE